MLRRHIQDGGQEARGSSIDRHVFEVLVCGLDHGLGPRWVFSQEPTENQGPHDNPADLPVFFLLQQPFGILALGVNMKDDTGRNKEDDQFDSHRRTTILYPQNEHPFCKAFENRFLETLSWQQRLDCFDFVYRI